LGLVKKIVDEMNELAAGLGNFSNHDFINGSGRQTRLASTLQKKGRRAGALGDGSVRKKRPGFPVAQFPARRPQVSSIDRFGTGTGEGIGRIVMLLWSGMRR
jgi:hypothetical protein